MNWTHHVRNSFAVMLLALSVTTCSLRDEPAGPGVSTQSLVVAPQLPPNFTRFAGGLGVDRVHLVIHGQGNRLLLDQVIPFSPFATSVTLQLPLQLTAAAESLTVDLTYQDQVGTALFVGQQTFQARIGSNQPPPQIPVSYVGPGQNVYYVTISPGDSLVTVGDTVQMSFTAYDTSFQVVPNVYVSWQTDDPAAPIDAFGRLPASSRRSVAVIYAETPNGSATSTRMYFSPGQIAIAPDSLEALPGAFTSFYAYSDLPFGSYKWTVNGIPGGNATVGTIDSTYGYYSAPAVPPSPATVQVCATTGTDSSCAPVLVSSPPTPGGDLATFGDTYLFTDAALAAEPGNRALLTRLIGFSGVGARGGSSAKTILFDRGRNSTCLASGICADSALISLSNALTTAGYTIQRRDTLVPYRNISAAVKTIVVWNPTVYLSDKEMNELKRFARGGGRIVLVADDTTSLGGSSNNTLNVISDFGYRLGTSQSPYSIDVGCGGPTTLTGPDIQAHQITSGVTSVQILCASGMFTGSNAYTLLTSAQQIVAAVSKIDLTPESSYGD